MNLISKLDPAPWIISPTEEILEIYNYMKKFEKEWIDEIGYEIKSGNCSRGIIVTPYREIYVPQKLKQISRLYLQKMQEEAKRQQKKSTIGTRSAQDIKWTTPNGKIPIDGGRWNYMGVSRITVRRNMAWRGGFISLSEALDFLYYRKNKLENSMSNSLAAYQKERYQEQSDKYNEALKAISEIKRIILKYGVADISARIQSGSKVTFRFFIEKSIAWTETAGRYLVIHSKDNLGIEKTRNRKVKKEHHEIANFSDVSLFSKKQINIYHHDFEVL